jgi:hypothetical protein
MGFLFLCASTLKNGALFYFLQVPDGTSRLCVSPDIIPRFTAHKGDQDQAINAAAIIQPKDFNILVHFEYKDEIVGNNTDALFYKTIMGPDTYLVLADDGGHLHNGYTLGRAIQPFREKYNGAYYNLSDLLKDGEKLLAKSPQEPKQVDTFVKKSYSDFEQLRKKKK